jgi:hypothetical protein
MCGRPRNGLCTCTPSFGSAPSYFLSGSFGFTVLLLSGILSRPWSPLSSLPPDVEVPLPLGLEELPTVPAGAARGFAELAAGSPATDPRPLGSPCAIAVDQKPVISDTKRIRHFIVTTRSKLEGPARTSWVLIAPKTHRPGDAS